MALPSLLAPETYPTLTPLKGVRLATAQCGIRYKNRTDVMLAELAVGTTVAGVFTKSLTASAPVIWCQQALKKGTARVLVVNSGNANAFTGRAGMQSVEWVAKSISDLFDCRLDEIFQSSTGVIAEPLPEQKIIGALEGLKKNLNEASWEEAAKAIMTTDAFPKYGTRTAIIGEATVTIQGFAKGAGMIAPDMATMLAYVFTDARLPASVLQELLNEANEQSFNCITVDGDTSTSDTVLLFATGQGAAHPAIAKASDPGLADFKTKLRALMQELAHMIVRDGEGARKFVTIHVKGADSDQAAKRIAFSIGNSPLVKTAMAGEDANWGRIVMAVGKAGEKADRDKLSIWIGGHQVAKDGGPMVNYDEKPVAQHMKGREIDITVDIGIGKGSATIWTCDLNHTYIDINGSYRS